MIPAALRSLKGLGGYRERIWKLMQPLLETLEPVESALDFGSGDGWFAARMCEEKKAGQIQAVDVKEQAGSCFPALIYDGCRLPFPERAFELTYAIDVLHHCPDPPAQLRDVLRCTERAFLLKDHTSRTQVDRFQLAIMDEIGNRGFGIPSLFQYQHAWSWDQVFLECGFKRSKLIYPAPCHAGILGGLTNHLQFLALWER